jgi:hypothetical protein
MLVAGQNLNRKTPPKGVGFDGGKNPCSKQFWLSCHKNHFTV